MKKTYHIPVTVTLATEIVFEADSLEEAISMVMKGDGAWPDRNDWDHVGHEVDEFVYDEYPEGEEVEV